MAGADSDVDMSPPKTPTRASLSPIILNSDPTQRSRTVRFTDVESTQTLAFIRQPRLNPEVFSPHNPFVALERNQDENFRGNINPAMEEGSYDTKWAAEHPGRAVDIDSKALDEVTNCIQEMGIREPKRCLENTLEQKLQILAWEEDQIEASNSLPRLAQSIHAPPLKGNIPCQILQMPKSRRKKLNFKAIPGSYLKDGLKSRSHRVHALKTAPSFFDLVKYFG